MTTFRYDKDMLMAEFKIAKDKDIKLGKGNDNKNHTNRIKFLKEMIELEKQSPEVFENVDVNFNNLLLAYQSPNPRDHFYMSIFGKTYLEKMSESALERSERERSIE